MIEDFEKGTKPIFSDVSERSFIKFGSNRDKDLDVGIRNGQLALEGCVKLTTIHRLVSLTNCRVEVAHCFQPSVSAIITAIRAQRRAASKPVDVSVNLVEYRPYTQGTLQMAFLVGGFAASPWLFAQLKAVLAPFGMSISRPDDHT